MSVGFGLNGIQNRTGNRSSVYLGGMFQQAGTLKSTREKAERQQKAQGQVDFWEQQKENLKDVECGSLEEISRKLEMFHSYEDQITAAKATYNNEQMSHIMDEAEERAEKIAESVEDMEPKTEEERKEDAAKEALEDAAGEEAGGEGVLSEIMDELEELLPEEDTAVQPEDMAGLLPEDAQVKEKDESGMLPEDVQVQAEDMAELLSENAQVQPENTAGMTGTYPESLKYRPFDTRI